MFGGLRGGVDEERLVLVALPEADPALVSTEHHLLTVEVRIGYCSVSGR
jgi:hypothetical protein